MIFLELSAAALLLASLGLSRSFRLWLSNVKRGDLVVCAGIFVLLFVGQFLWMGRYTFPLVHWSMYTTVNSPAEFQIVECRAVCADGTRIRFNPVKMFPSLTRNFGERFQLMVSARQRGTLTADGERVYSEMMNTLLTRYQQNNRSNPAIAMEAVLVTRNSGDGRFLSEAVVSRNEWRANTDAVAHIDAELQRFDHQTHSQQTQGQETQQ